MKKFLFFVLVAAVVLGGGCKKNNAVVDINYRVIANFGEARQWVSQPVAPWVKLGPAAPAVQAAIIPMSSVLLKPGDIITPSSIIDIMEDGHILLEGCGTGDQFTLSAPSRLSETFKPRLVGVSLRDVDKLEGKVYKPFP